MSVPQHLEPFWRSFAEIARGPADERFYEAFYFGDSEALANELAGLVLQGKKRATAGSVWCAETDGKRLPQPRDLSIVTSWSGGPLCIIETESLNVIPFNEVQADFAAAEGEADGSLDFWREAHRRYFTRECLAAGREFNERMLVACERFKVIYSAAGGA
jgi:uncharacterized protein YhfF